MRKKARTLKRRQLVSIVACALIPIGAFAQLAESLEKRTDAVFSSLKPGEPGCACGVIKQGELVYAKGFGAADLEHDAKLDADSVFYIASTSKQFTAASIALLVLENKLALDDDIRKYLPEMPDYGARITVDNLVHHTSGIRDYLELLALAGRADAPLDNDIAVALVARQKGLNAVPGERHLYSNSNYVLLAEIVKRVTGQSMARFAKDRVFVPLGMSTTAFGDDLSEIVPNRVISYGKRPGGRPFQFIKTIRAYGDGNLLTSVRDLAKWDENFYRHTVGGAELVNLMRTRGQLNSGEAIDYAFGLNLGIYRGLAYEWHGGSFLGFRTDMIRFPAQRTSVIVLCNDASANTGDFSRRVTDIYLERELQPVPAKTVSKSSFAEIAIKPEAFDAYVGTYVVPGVGSRKVVTIMRDGGKYLLQIPGQLRQELFPYGDSQFFIKAVDAQITFHREPDGSVRRMTLHQGVDRSGERIDVATPSAAELDALAGEYYSAELDSTVRAVSEQGRLFMQGPGGGPMALMPLIRDSFTMLSADIRFRRNSNGTVDSFTYTSTSMDGLLFERKR